jgi:phospholipase C
VKAGGGIWSAYQAVKHIYNGPDWHEDIVTPQTKLFRDVSAGNLPVVSWVTPTCVNSDHAGCGGKTGPDWVGALSGF